MKRYSTNLRDEPLAELKNERNIIEMALMVFALIAGIKLFIDPPALTHPISEVWRYAWRSLLIGCSCSVLLGLLWTGRTITAFSLLQLGYIGFGFSALAYGVATGDAYPMIFGAASLGRFIQVDLYLSSVNPALGVIRGLHSSFHRSGRNDE